MKVCSKCKIDKILKDFHKQSRRKDGLHPWCKECISIVGKLRQDIKNEQTRKWRLNNPEKNKECDKKSRQKRKVKIREEQRAWQKKTRLENLSFRLAQNIRSRLRLALKHNQKKGKTLEYLGCSIEFLKTHLESNFKKDMSWNNYGEWHIDHIIPLSKFDLSNEAELRKASHYTNLQPLWAKDNIIKGAKYVIG